MSGDIWEESKFERLLDFSGELVSSRFLFERKRLLFGF